MAERMWLTLRSPHPFLPLKDVTGMVEVEEEVEEEIKEIEEEERGEEEVEEEEEGKGEE